MSRFAILLAILTLVVASPATAQLGPVAGNTQTTPPAFVAFRPYLLRLAEPDVLVLARGEAADLEAAARQRQREELAQELAQLAATGLAGAYAFDEATAAFRADLSHAGRDRLAAHPQVAAVEPAPAAAPEAAAAPASRTASSGDRTIQGVSSVIFAQVYSPFVWGRANIGGLSVELTLEDSNLNLKGVAYQTTRPAPNNIVKVDRTQLYLETYFVAPGNSSQPVMIVPGDRVHIVTSGDDPNTPFPDPPEDKRVIVDDVRAWTSYEQDRVGGTAPANATMIVTVTSSSPSLSQYLAPGTYAELTAGSDGSFAAPQFRTSTNSTYNTVDLKQGSTGFVRVRHADGNEIYTVHGQNVLVMQNSSVVHGYAFQLPSAPSGLETGVTVSRPRPTVDVTLKNAAAQVKAADSATITSSPYTFQFRATILGGDRVEVAINGGPINEVQISPLTATVDLGANQVTGTGPASTGIVLGAGRINGYISSSSTFSSIEKRVTTDSAGRYASGQFQCGTSNLLALRPGSFGYAGYEGPGGNFVYLSFAAPTNYVMSDYSFLEGWLATGLVRPTVTHRGATGAIKQEATASPLLLYMTTQRLYLNTYYQLQTAQFILPGDSVAVSAGGQTATIPVERITAFVNPDSDVIAGEAPVGATVRVVPENDRTARQEVVVGSDGTYRARNPFISLSNGTCTESTTTKSLAPGDAGRAYVRHADGNEVFAAYGRSMHVNLNENYLELYLFATRDLDWDPTTRRTATVTLTPRQGSPTTVDVLADFGREGKTRVSLVDGQSQRVIIRPGDSLTATFDEGPGAPIRTASLAMSTLPLVTGSPDTDTDTLAGVGPRGWDGQALLNPPPTAKAGAIAASVYAAYSPLQFFTVSNALIPLVQGYSGTVSFGDLTGHRIWMAWAVTATPVKITSLLGPGDTVVCGTALAGSTVNIDEVTAEGQAVLIGTGTANAEGKFCITVNPLVAGQVLLAEANGTFSQPVIVRYHVSLPGTFRAASGGW
ncbi:MAG: hypothetical protein HYY04_09400 [Chloroflexi bacterium]|nr:hypothetical protein [Chloroflexota bacterium]